MNCPNCGVKLASISKFCPECGAKLTVHEEKKNNKAPDSIEELLVTIVQNYGGAELYKESNARKLAGLLKDFAGSIFQDEVKLLSRVVPEGFQEILYNANNSSPEEKQGALAACKMKLIDNLYFSEAKAAEATNILVAGLCWSDSQTFSDVSVSDDKEKTPKTTAVQQDKTPQKVLPSKGIIVDNDYSRAFQTLGEAVKIAKDGSEIKLNPGIYIEPENFPLIEINKKIKITGCTEDISSKDFSELPIVVLNKKNFYKITSDAVIEGVVFTSEKNIEFKKLKDYIFSKDKDSFFWLFNSLDEVSPYSSLLVEGNADLKNIAVLGSRSYHGITFTSEKGSLTDSIVALNHKGILISEDSNPEIYSCDIYCNRGNGIVIEKNAKGSYRDCDIHYNRSSGIEIDNKSVPSISDCRIHENWNHQLNISDESKPKISNCKIYDNDTKPCLFVSSGVFVQGSSEPEIAACEIYDHPGNGITITENAKGSYRDCDIHHNQNNFGIEIIHKSEPSISGCRIHDNRIYGLYISCKRVNISNCKIYDNGKKGIDVGCADGEITSCEIFGNHEVGLSLYASRPPKISNCYIHDNDVNLKDGSNGKAIIQNYVFK